MADDYDSRKVVFAHVFLGDTEHSCKGNFVQSPEK